jgi:hypothetical protein
MPLAPSGRKVVSMANRIPVEVWTVIQVLERWGQLGVVAGRFLVVVQENKV